MRGQSQSAIRSVAKSCEAVEQITWIKENMNLNGLANGKLSHDEELLSSRVILGLHLYGEYFFVGCVDVKWTWESYSIESWDMETWNHGYGPPSHQPPWCTSTMAQQRLTPS